MPPLSSFDSINDELARRIRRIDNGSTVNAFDGNYQSRRVTRTLRRWLGPTACETLEAATYVYHGWNLAAEIAMDYTQNATVTTTSAVTAAYPRRSTAWLGLAPI